MASWAASSGIIRKLGKARSLQIGSLPEVVWSGGMAQMDTVDIEGSQRLETVRRSAARKNAVHGSLSMMAPVRIFRRSAKVHHAVSSATPMAGSIFLGDYDEATAKFRPYDHGRFNHGQMAPGGVHAPSAATDRNGDVINILNINAAKPTAGWDQIMSLPQRLSLDADKRLRIEPIETVASLRGEHRQVGETTLACQ